MKKLILAFSLAAFAFAVGACNTTHEPKTVKLSQVDQGQTTKLNKGDTLVITLASNRTTGYSWMLADASKTSTVVVPMSAPDYTQEESGVVGGGGSETFTFKAVEAGTQDIRIAYRRPFESNAQPAMTFAVTVEVK